MVTKPENLSLSWAFLGCNPQFLLFFNCYLLVIRLQLPEELAPQATD